MYNQKVEVEVFSFDHNGYKQAIRRENTKDLFDRNGIEMGDFKEVEKKGGILLAFGVDSKIEYSGDTGESILTFSTGIVKEEESGKLLNIPVSQIKFIKD